MRNYVQPLAFSVFIVLNACGHDSKDKKEAKPAQTSSGQSVTVADPVPEPSQTTQAQQPVQTQQQTTPAAGYAQPTADINQQQPAPGAASDVGQYQGQSPYQGQGQGRDGYANAGNGNNGAYANPYYNGNSAPYGARGNGQPNGQGYPSQQPNGQNYNPALAGGDGNLFAKFQNTIKQLRRHNVPYSNAEGQMMDAAQRNDNQRAMELNNDLLQTVPGYNYNQGYNQGMQQPGSMQPGMQQPAPAPRRGGLPWQQR